MKDYYQILGIEQDSSPEEIKVVYRKLANKFHPDKNNGDKYFETRFKEIQEAYEILKDPIKRNRYDFNRTTTYSSEYVEPSVDFFSCSKKTWSNGDIITVSWKTTSANKVIINLFGEVELSGKKKIKLSKPTRRILTIKITATNHFSTKKATDSLDLLYVPIQTRQGDNEHRQTNGHRKSSMTKMILMNAVLKPLLIFGILSWIIYLIFK